MHFKITKDMVNSYYFSYLRYSNIGFELHEDNLLLLNKRNLHFAENINVTLEGLIAFKKSFFR